MVDTVVAITEHDRYYAGLKRKRRELSERKRAPGAESEFKRLLDKEIAKLDKEIEGWEKKR